MMMSMILLLYAKVQVERERENSSDSTAILVYRVCIHVTLWPHHSNDNQHKYAEMIYIQIFNFNLCPLSEVCRLFVIFVYSIISYFACVYYKL